MLCQKESITKISIVLLLIGIMLISPVSAGALNHNNSYIGQSPTNKEIVLPKEGTSLSTFSSGNLISLITPQGNISPYYAVNSFSSDKPDWQKQRFSITIALPAKPESISFGLYDKNMAACCGGSPFRGRTDFIY